MTGERSGHAIDGDHQFIARLPDVKCSYGIIEPKSEPRAAAVSLASLRIPPGNHLEALSQNRQGQHSIRINDQYRICFIWTDEGPERVEITDYH